MYLYFATEAENKYMWFSQIHFWRDSWGLWEEAA